MATRGRTSGQKYPDLASRSGLRQGLNGISCTLKERGKLVNQPRTVAVFFRQQRPLELSDGSSHIDLVDAKHKIAWN
jgi:hypothetical protein